MGVVEELSDRRLRYLAYMASEKIHRDIDTSLSPTVRKEREAGRARLYGMLRGSIVDVGVAELQRRFGKRSVPNADVRFVEESNEWQIDVVVHTQDNRIRQFSEPMMNFPSDELFAQIALVT